MRAWTLIDVVAIAGSLAILGAVLFLAASGRLKPRYALLWLAASSLLVLFSVWRGESNVREKVNEVVIGFSRDGFHWHRPDRNAFLPVSEQEGSWNWANVQSAGGGCVIVGDWESAWAGSGSSNPEG